MQPFGEATMHALLIVERSFENIRAERRIRAEVEL